jgi:ligand-binding sensor domain-containing protein
MTLSKNTIVAARLMNLFILVWFTFSTNAQGFATHLYTTADGLSDNYIFSIYQDSFGYLWIGTANGLNRFDGKHFTSYGLQQGLPSMMVDRIYEDNKHRLWVGTRAGIAQLKGDSCYVYPVNDHQRIRYVSGFLQPDSSKLWVTTNRGLYELRDSQWVKISLLQGYENHGIGKIIKTSKGFLVNYDNDKLLQLDLNGQSKTLLSVQTNEPYYNSLYNLNDTVYISTYSGLFQLQHDKWVALFSDILRNKYIYHSFRDKSNRWWFGTKEDGVLVLIPTNEKTNHVSIPLSFNLVSQFFEDRDNNIWVAGLQGLLKVSPSYYQTVSSPELEDMHFIRNCIRTPTNEIVVSGENGKLIIFQSPPLQGNYPVIKAIRQLKDKGDFIDFYTFDEKQRMWFATREGRLYRLDHSTLEDFTSIVPFKNEQFRGLAYNKKTRQLFVCADSVLLKGNEKRLDTLFSKDRKQFIPLPYIVYLNEGDGSLLVQTVELGAFLVDSEGEIHALNKSFNFSSSSAAFGGKEDESIIWSAAQGRNLTKYKWAKNNVPEPTEIITEKNGLSNNRIISIVSDNDKLWLATTKGLTLMQKKGRDDWVFEEFAINNSGNPVPLTFAKLSRDGDGNVWMNTKDHLLEFDSKTTVHPVYTNTVIEKILLNNQTTNWRQVTDSINNYDQLPVNPVLKYNQNTLSISFNALQFSDNSQIEYSYRLKPSDHLWSNPITGNVVSFYQLIPGQYQFEVRSHVKGFDWSKPASFSFNIGKPFWETWWFRFAVIAIAAALIVAIFRYRLKQLRTSSELQNQLHELETKAFKLQMNPHFIYNALNSIQSLVVSQKNKEASHYIGKFAKLLRQVLENSDHEMIDLEKELYSLQLYVDLEKWRMNTDIDYSVKKDPSVFDSNIKIPPLILQPFVENALWHGLRRKEGEKKILLNISRNRNWFVCRIIDNGIGRKEASQSYESFPEGHLSKAVAIIRQRLSDFNKPYTDDPIQFIDLEENGKPLGTEVIIKIRNS